MGGFAPGREAPIYKSISLHFPKNKIIFSCHKQKIQDKRILSNNKNISFLAKQTIQENYITKIKY
jgi:hypothetical protein